MIKNDHRRAARLATQAIERLYITMRYLFNRGYYKPMGPSGATMRESLLALKPEIYGSIAEDKVELNGLIYVLERLPYGIEECNTINLTADEGVQSTSIPVIIPPKRRRRCYRIDSDQMNIEITRGRSDIYDILTHLTFLFLESHKIAKRVVLDESGTISKEWNKIESFVQQEEATEKEIEVALMHLSNVLGRTYDEVIIAYRDLQSEQQLHRFIHTIYWLGKYAIDEVLKKEERVILFSPVLRERLGHHLHGEVWANNIKKHLLDNELCQKNIHIISANMHSVMNMLYAKQALKQIEKPSKKALFEQLSESGNHKERKVVVDYALKNGMELLSDTSGTNIDVQIFDLSKIDLSKSFFSNHADHIKENDLLIVMDYAFGEQAFETLDELLKPLKNEQQEVVFKMKVASISIMGKAGVLPGQKGDIMVPKAHIFEGTSDNYPFNNELTIEDFEGHGVAVFGGHMITVLGTSLQNRELLKYFKTSSWKVTGLEMEGAHYQKAIQAAAKLRGNISENVKLRYAYYASDNPLETGSTLASGGLGLTGVKPTYLITEKIIAQILECK
ncbi:MAG: hypothetical protein JJT77_09515 [Crocinitomicaceae bacterium]|nr:hypothetical protein [Crocinitomicaceae bacterium]